jgi:dihydrofolate reductase
MGKVIATITQSVDGHIVGPADRPGQGLGVGGERLHYWVMGGPWTYESDREGDPGAGMGPEDRAFFEELTAGVGAGVIGRGMYDAAEAWGGTNPFGGPLYVVTHRVEDQPDESAGFRFVSGVEEGVAAAREAAGGQHVAISGGADVIRQALSAGLVDELVLSTAPVVLGAGKRLFEGFTHDLNLEIRNVHPSPYAVHVRYAVVL